jgi:hypothetical protein
MPRTFKDRPQVVASHLIAVDGRIVGGWRRLTAQGAMIAETMLVARLSAAEGKALRAAAERLQKFLGMPVKLRARKMPAS